MAEKMVDPIYNDFFESLVEGLSEDEKIDLWNSGKRKVNIKACSDEKLNRYYDIANSKGYIAICDQIEQEAAGRGLTLSGTYTSPIAPTYTANSGSPTAPAPAAPAPEPATPSSTTSTSTTSAAAPKSVLEELKEIAKKNAPRSVTYKMSTSDVEYYEEQLMNELVPGRGDSDTLAGEILSAWNYGLYRCLNDGDWFYGFGTTWNTNAQRCVQYLKDYVGPGLGNAAMYATGEYDFADKGNKLILNKIFKEKLYNYRCRESWRSYNYN